MGGLRTSQTAPPRGLQRSLLLGLGVSGGRPPPPPTARSASVAWAPGSPSNTPLPSVGRILLLGCTSGRPFARLSVFLLLPPPKPWPPFILEASALSSARVPARRAAAMLMRAEGGGGPAGRGRLGGPREVGGQQRRRREAPVGESRWRARLGGGLGGEWAWTGATSVRRLGAPHWEGDGLGSGGPGPG